VSKTWRKESFIAAEELLVEPIQILCNVCMGYAQEFQEKERGKVKSRFQFLETTLRLINKWELPVYPESKIWRLLCIELRQRLEETLEILILVEGGKFMVNENFDVFELGLRRYYQNISFLQKIKVANRSSDLISDVEGRQMWRKHFGENTVFVSWKLFKMTIYSNRPKNLRRAVKFLINFPADNLITIYKFDLLCRHFGPYPQLDRNINLYALGPGFAGLINRIHAKQLLYDHWKKNRGKGYYLIRLSRTEPEYIVFSVISREGVCSHTLNKNMTIREKILRSFSGGSYGCLPVRLSNEVYNNEELSSYAGYHSGYVTIDSDGDDDDSSDLYLETEIGKAAKVQKPRPMLLKSNSYSVFD